MTKSISFVAWGNKEEMERRDYGGVQENLGGIMNKVIILMMVKVSWVKDKNTSECGTFHGGWGSTLKLALCSKCMTSPFANFGETRVGQR